jgi:hypothetical protein
MLCQLFAVNRRLVPDFLAAYYTFVMMLMFCKCRIGPNKAKTNTKKNYDGCNFRFHFFTLSQQNQPLELFRKHTSAEEKNGTLSLIRPAATVFLN